MAPKHSGSARSKKLQWILIGTGGGLLLLVVLAWLLVPGIASGIARRKIEQLAGEKIMGKVSVRQVALTWRGPSKVTAVELRDDLDRLVATLDIDLSIGIFSALGGLDDLGQITLSGQGQILAKRMPDGSVETNLQRALRPRTPSTDPTKIPPGLRLALTTRELTVNYKETDGATGQTLAEASVAGLEATATIDGGPKGTGGAKIDAKLKAKLRQGNAPDGALVASLSIDKLTGADGVVNISAANIDTSASLDALPVRLADALAMQGGLLTDVLGDRATVVLSAKGSLGGRADIEVIARSDQPARAPQAAEGAPAAPAPAGRPRAELSGTFSIRDGVLSATSPATVWLDDSAPLRRVPALDKALRQANINLVGMPSLDLSIVKLRLPMPKAGSSTDLRDAAIDLKLALSPLRGELRADAQTTWKFDTEPVALTLAGDPLSGDVRVTAGAAGTLGGLRAGTLSLAMTAGRILDDRGAPRGLPGKLAGTADIKGVSTEVLSRVVAAMAPTLKDRLMLTQDIGPTIDLSLSAQTQTQPQGQSQGQAAPTALVIEVKSANFAVAGKWSLSETQLRTTEPMIVELRSAGPTLDRFIAGRTPAADAARVSGAVPIRIQLDEATVPLANGSVDMPGTTFKGRLLLSGLTVTTGAGTPAASDAVVQSADVVFSRAAGAAPVVVASVAGSSDGKPMNVEARVELSGTALGPAVARAIELPGLGMQRLTGTLNVRGLPVDALGTMLPRESDGSTSKLARALVIAGAPTADLTVNLGGTPSPIEQVIESLLVSGGTSANATLALRPEQAEVAAKITMAVEPAQARQLQALWAAPGAPTPGDDAPALMSRVVIVAEVPTTALPLTRVPLGLDRTKLAASSPIVATLSTQGPVEVAAVVQGQRTEVRINGLQASAELPAARLLGRTEGTLKASASGTLLATRGGQPLGDGPAELTARAVLTPDDALDATAQVSKLSTVALDTLMGDPGLVSGAMGPQATIVLAARRPARAAGATATAPIDITATITASRLSVSELALAYGPEGLRLLRTPVSVSWDPDAQWLTDRLLSKPGAQDGLAASDRAPVTLTINALAIAPAWNSTPDRVVGPLAAPAFNIDAAIKLDRLSLVRRGSAAPASVSRTLLVEGVTASIASQPGPEPSLRVRARVSNINDGNRGSGADPLQVDLTIKRYADANGTPSMRSAVIDGTITTADLPTDLIESVAAAPDALAPYLGATAKVQVTLKNASLGPARDGAAAAGGTGAASGTADIRLTSPKADLRLAGPISEGVLRVQEQTPLELSLKDFLVGKGDAASAAPTPASPPAGQTAPGATRNPFARLAQARAAGPAGGGSSASALGGVLEGILSPLNALDLNASRPSGGPPALVSSRNLAIPLDGDMAKLDGDIDVALGKLDYRFGGDFGPFLAADVLNLPAADRLAIPSFLVKVRKGVMTFDAFQLPLQTGTIKTTGTVDLVTKQLDLVAMLPLAVASSGLSGQLTGALGPAAQFLPGLAADLTMVPIRVRGPFGQTRPQPDIELWLRSVGQNLLPKSPEDLGRKLLPNILGDRGIPGLPRPAAPQPQPPAGAPK